LVAPVVESSLQVRSAPPVSVEARNRQEALDFLRDPAVRGDGVRPNPAAQDQLAAGRKKRAEATSLQEVVDASSWYHTLELPGNIVTAGAHDHRQLVDRMGLPDSLEGVRALDVATFDGFWAFELERRGADVVAVDLPDVAGLDWPTGVGDIVRAEALNVALGESFAVAHQALGSKVQRVERSVYELDPGDLGTFDLVFVGDLLLHLERPLEALRRVRRVTSPSGRLVLVDRFDPSISTASQDRLVRYEGGWHGLEWWAPSLGTLAQWVIDAGFGQVDVQGVYQQATTFGGAPGWHRAIIHATV
jgi:tRNA (mo5U34)-methyltransferase